MRCDSPLFQAVRIADVFIIGPVMIQAGRKMKGNAGTFLMLVGIATIIFNGLTFLDIENE